MKKYVSILLAMVMALSLLAACGKGNDGPSGIYYDLTGIAPDEVMMTVDGQEIPAELYFYWQVFSFGSVSQQVRQLNSSYGMFQDAIDPDTGRIDWTGAFGENTTLGEYAKQSAEDTVKFMVTVETVAKENGVILTEEDLAALEKSHTDAMERNGGEEGFQKFLDKMGITLPTLDRVNGVNYLIKGLKELVLQEGSSLYLDPAAYEEYLVFADHILISTRDGEDQPLEEKAKAEKLALAEELLEKLQKAEDLQAEFNALAGQYSEDPGRAVSPAGYVFGPGEMVAPFEEAALALKPGELSGIVESDFGYHILLRKELSEGLKTAPERLDQLAQEHLDGLLQARQDKMEITFSEQAQNLDAADFYTRYMEKIMAMEEAEAPAGEPDDAPAEESDEAPAEDEKPEE